MLRGLQAQQGVSSASLSQVMRGFRGNMRVGKPPAHGATACSLCGCEGSLWRGSWVGSEGTAEGQEPPRRHWRADSDRANRCILEPQQPSHVVPGAPAPPTPRRPEWVSPPTAKPDTSCWLCLVIRGDCWLPAAILRASALTQPDQRTHVPPLCLAGGSSLRVHPGAERGPDWGGRVEKGGAQTSGGRGDPGGHWLCLCLVAALRCVCVGSEARQCSPGPAERAQGRKAALRFQQHPPDFRQASVLWQIQLRLPERSQDRQQSRPCETKWDTQFPNERSLN